MTLARRAGTVSLLTAFLAVIAYWWNSRRFPSAGPLRSRRRRRWQAAAAVTRVALVRGQTARAGFFFTLAAVWRSNLHRLTIACAGAASVAAAVVTLSGLNLQDVSSVSGLPTGVFAIQPMFYGALLVAFRHGIRVPAELRANWGFQLAWRDQAREFLTGVRRGALAGVVVPALLIVLPLFWYFLGFTLAVAHALLGFAGRVVMLEVLLFSYEKVPFTCTYIPSENMKALAVIPYVLIFLTGASAFARMERSALQDPIAAVRLLVLLSVVAVLRFTARRRSRQPIKLMKRR